jgi:hypothetical protein
MLGLTGGLNQATFSQVNTSLLTPIGSYNSWQGGIFVKELSKNVFNMGLELNYRRKSDELSVFNSSGLASANQLRGHFKLDYASLVLLPELRAGKKIEYFINGGGYFGWLVNSSFSGDDISYGYIYHHPPFYGVSENPRSYFPGYDVGLVANAGMSYIYREIWRFSLCLRYMASFPDGDYRSQDLGFLFSIARSSKRKVFQFLEH